MGKSGWCEFARVFSTEILNGLDTAAAPAWIAQEAAEIDAVPQDSWFAAKFTFSGSLSGECCLRIAAERAEMLAASCKAEGNRTDILLTAMASAAARFAQDRRDSYGGFAVEAAPVQSWPSGLDYAARIAFSDNESPILVYVSISASLALALAGAQDGRSASGESGMGIAQLAPHRRNLDVVMDVELEVVLRFGQRQLTLREVLELTSGSVVELDRQVDEPIELLLDGKVIARGEAVVIDGNYGLRVTEVVAPVAARVCA